MFGLWFSIAGMITGIICSYIAKKKNRTQKNWYMLGQLFPIISIIIISMLDAAGKTSVVGKNDITYDPLENDYYQSLRNLS